MGTWRINHGALAVLLAVPAWLPTTVNWLLVARGDADGVVGEKDALGNGMIGLVVEITMDDGKDMVVLCARLVGVNNTIAETAPGKGPQLHAPKVKAGIPKCKPFTDMVGLPPGFSKIVIEQGGNDLGIILGLLQKRGNLARFRLITDHQAPQISGCIWMQ
jgi:hypothetical protein